ncbi:STAS domain-containing protein [Nonomuraea sp. PA05]|uniref:STAS domain-containing protein n=1 Tax=Nonomuraea sp. PA05 TaxID=2604466 RepID=UPI0011D86E8C|nr:STAS domain-containing protein [Nonomuraea sp. PA05]TYB56029.1 STAS domain-containing protein [Nonomuraea sp. PA05]
MPSLTFSSQYLPGVTVIAVAGRADITTAYLLDDYIGRTRRHPGDHLVLDLSEVPYLGESALHVLLRAHTVARHHGAGLHLAALQRGPAHLLHATEAAGGLNVHDTLEGAIRAALRAAQPVPVSGQAAG